MDFLMANFNSFCPVNCGHLKQKVQYAWHVCPWEGKNNMVSRYLCWIPVSCFPLRVGTLCSSCPAGWGFDARYTVKLGKLAVETGLFDLYEIENGKFSLTGASKKLIGKKRIPVNEYFNTQTRFKALSDKMISDIQKETDAKWNGYNKKPDK